MYAQFRLNELQTADSVCPSHLLWRQTVQQQYFMFFFFTMRRNVNQGRSHSAPHANQVTSSPDRKSSTVRFKKKKKSRPKETALKLLNPSPATLPYTVASTRPSRTAPHRKSSGGGVVMMGRRAAKIAKVKGREDAKRGKAFARIGKKIIMVSSCFFEVFLKFFIMVSCFFEVFWVLYLVYTPMSVDIW